MRAALFSVIALIAANQVAGAVVDIPRGEDLVERDADEILIATSSFYACNCPNNCSHKSGSSCKYYSGPSDSSPIIDGKCQYQGTYLQCVAT